MLPLNLENLLVSTSWLSIIIARKMRKLKKYGSIINLGSIYGVVGQNLNVYKNFLSLISLPYNHA